MLRFYGEVTRGIVPTCGMSTGQWCPKRKAGSDAQRNEDGVDCPCGNRGGRRGEACPGGQGLPVARREGYGVTHGRMVDRQLVSGRSAGDLRS